MSILEGLSEEECYLYAIFSDRSGLDLAEFSMVDLENDDACFRAWAYQWKWWRDNSTRQIDCASRSVGKSLSIRLRAYAFPFNYPNQEMVITAPEGVHLDAITDVVETAFMNNRLARYMLAVGRSRIKHRPFHVSFENGSRIMGRIPQHDGKGIKGCVEESTLILTIDGYKKAIDVNCGDTVLGKDGWTKVAGVSVFEDEAYRVRGSGSYELIVNSLHRFYGVKNLETSKKKKRDMADPKWFLVENGIENQYWASPRNLPNVYADVSEYEARNLGYSSDAVGKEILFSNNEIRRAFIDGFLKRVDGPVPNEEFLFALTLVAQSIGLYVSYVDGSIVISDQTNCYIDDEFVYSEIEGLEKLDDNRTFVNLITEDHTLITGNIVSHNTHPVVLEQDEACFPADTLILTKKGYKRIVDIVPGEMVLTHKNRWRKVLENIDNGERDVVEIRGHGHPNLRVTPNHRFWARTPEFKDKVNNWGVKSFGPYEWIQADDLKNKYWTSFNQIAPVEIPALIARAKTGSNNKDYQILNPDFIWLLGLYAAEGSTSSAYGAGKGVTKATWSIHVDEVDYVMKRMRMAGLKAFVQPVQCTENCFNVVVASVELAKFVDKNIGKGCYSKTVPNWVMSLPEELRSSFLDGLVYGDGYNCSDDRYAPGRWKLSTTSKALAFSARTLAQSLGYHVAVHYVPGGRIGSIRGKEFISGPSYQIVGSRSGYVKSDGDYCLSRVKSVKPAGRERVYDLTVEDDHSFVAEGVIVHNSDYPMQGWMEIIETLKMGSENCIWKSHGVTRGVRDHFYKFTQPDSGWKVHRIVAMARPTWTDEERQAKIELYGSRDHPDYRRNVLGDHGDSENVLFVLSRLMATVDQNEDSDYNSKLYTSIKITPEKIAEVGGVLNLLDIPRTHMEYEKFWIGMDVGYINDPSEIVVFGEETVGKKRTLRLLARFSLERVAHQDQVETILWVLETYKPQAFSCDKMQPISEPVLTPGGWVPIGDLSVGDSVIGSDGSPTKVMGVYPQTDRRVMKITFSDGSWTRCGPEHLWTVSRTVSRKKQSHTLTTEQLKGFMDAGIGPWNIPILSSPVEYDMAPELPIDPYLLGFLIGDGNLRKRSIRFSTADQEIVDKLKGIIPDDLEIRYQSKYDYHISTKEHRQKRRKNGTWCHENSLLESLRDLGMAGKYSYEKFIPEVYKYASVEDRIAILRGIMDSDGYCSNVGKSSHIGIRSSSEQLIKDVIEVLQSLGGFGTYTSHRTFCNGKEHRTAYRATLTFPAGINPFSLARKRDAVQPRVRERKRFVRSIEPLEDEDSVCIRVEAEDSLYATRNCILTHNTGLGLPLYQAILHETQKHPVLKRQTDKINGYGFSEKILAEIDTSIEVDPHMGDLIKEAGIHRNVLEWSTDILRGMVDKGTVVLPYDLSVIQQFQGQTYHYSKASQDMYGRRRIFSQGTFHVLDACRMAVLGWQQADLAPMLVQEKKQIARPMFMFG